jgi:glycerophosphoryl diester phosphodiesterase
LVLVTSACRVPRSVDLQGHRGARGLEPENTLPAFARALSIGVTTLELDLGLTRDGVLVASHDRRVSPDHARAPDGRWVAAPGPTIFSLTLEELRRFDLGRLRPGSADAGRFPGQRPRDGTSFATLREVFALARRAGNLEVRFNVETKLDPIRPEETTTPEAFADELVRVVREEGLADRTTIQSFDWRTLRRVRAVAPEIATAALTIRSFSEDNLSPDRSGRSPWLAGHDPAAHGGSLPRAVKALGARVWSPWHVNLTPAALREAHALGLEVVTWTVNEPERMAALIELGVDGLISDYPDRLRGVAARRGLALPRATPVEP